LAPAGRVEAAGYAFDFDQPLPFRSLSPYVIAPLIFNLLNFFQFLASADSQNAGPILRKGLIPWEMRFLSHTSVFPSRTKMTDPYS
jgi:hypothetical protein